MRSGLPMYTRMRVIKFSNLSPAIYKKKISIDKRDIETLHHLSFIKTYGSLDIHVEVFDVVYDIILGNNIYLIDARENACLTNPIGSVTVALSQELPFQC